jgi:hypothetical protein
MCAETLLAPSRGANSACLSGFIYLIQTPVRTHRVAAWALLQRDSAAGKECCLR